MDNKLTILMALALMSGSLAATAQKPAYLDDRQPIEMRVESALSLMTLEEKVALCHAQSKFSSKGVPRLGIPELWYDDGPHGVREEGLWDSWAAAAWTNDSCTAFPALTCLAATFSPEVSYIYGQNIGQEFRYRGKDVLLGPGVNIYRMPLNGRNFEYMGEDPFLASKLVVPYITGVQENGVAACVKHYALNNQEYWRNDVDVVVSDRALREIYLPAFKAAVVEGKVWTLMGAYNLYKGQHCCHNDILLNDILKHEWGFDGVVVSDWGGTYSTEQAANYGLDVEMGTTTNGLTSGKANYYSKYFLATPYLKALKDGTISTSTVDDKARRILRLIFRTAMNSQKPWGSFVNKEHSEAARLIAEQGIVLLKNDNNILPIVSDAATIAVIGENATRSLTVGGGSSSLKVAYEISPLEGMQQKFGADRVKYAMGYSSGKANYDREIAPAEDQQQLLKEAVEVAKAADMVVFVGGLNKNKHQDSESADRKSYALPFGQNELIEELLKVNKNVVVVLLSGNAVEMPWVGRVAAVVQGWYGGSECGSALANVLSGSVNPSGKLPFSFPVKLEDNAAMSFGEISYPGIDKRQEYKEDILVGYRWFDTKGIKPLYAFGHGLSYTQFDFGKVQTDKKKYAKNDSVKLTLSLTNSGKVDGAEVVQVYMSEPKATVLRPAKELKGFQKVFLTKGQTKAVEIKLPVSDWAFYDDKTRTWVVNSGEYIIHVGSASDNILRQISVMVD